MPVENHKRKVKFEKYVGLSNLESNGVGKLFFALQSILTDAWGRFPESFIEEHILKNALILVMAQVEGDYVGFCALSNKKIFNKDIRYVEFLVVKKKYQNSGLGSKLTYLTLRKDLLKSFLRIPPKPFDVMFITPNIRVLASTAKLCSFIYPNPYLSDKNGKIFPADDATFSTAQELIRKSDNSNRVINREGLVLQGSYHSTPWLIYTKDSVPWHQDEKINNFAIKYLGYGTGADKEFIVVAKITLFSLVNYFLKNG